MHVPTPHLHKKAEKRKASLDSVAHSDDADAPPAPVVEKKTMKCKKKAKMNKAKKEKSHTPEPRAVTPLSASPVPVAVADQPTSPHTTTAQRTPHESYVPPPTHRLPPSHPANPLTNSLSPTSTADLEPETPRRSSRLKKSISSVSSKWDKCRPYIERINGTIMPLEPQGTTAYYKRDGVGVD
jgi:hypothetical protein